MSATESGRIRTAFVGEARIVDPVREALGRRDDVEVVASGERAADVARALEAFDVDAVIVGAADGEFPADAIAAVRELTAAPVVLLAPPGALHLLEEALRADVADALLLPQPPEAVAFTIRKVAGAAAVPAPAQPATGRVVTVFSPKGGTGKSSTATNLAVALATAEQRHTLLVDLDLQFGDCAVMLGLHPERTIHDLVSAPGELDPDKLAGYVARHASGLDLLPAPAKPEEAELLPLARLARLLEVARESYELVVVDTTPFLHGPTLAALDETDLLLLLATLDVPTLKDVRQSLETLGLIEFPAERLQLVLNRADAPVGITQSDVEAALGRRFSFALPEDRRVPLSVNRSTPVVIAEPRSDFAAAIGAVARAVASQRTAVRA